MNADSKKDPETYAIIVELKAIKPLSDLETAQVLHYLEKDLEDAILRELETFLLELGQGFTFQTRQFRIPSDSDDFYLVLLCSSQISRVLIEPRHLEDPPKKERRKEGGRPQGQIPRILGLGCRVLHLRGQGRAEWSGAT